MDGSNLYKNEFEAKKANQEEAGGGEGGLYKNKNHCLRTKNQIQDNHPPGASLGVNLTSKSS